MMSVPLCRRAATAGRACLVWLAVVIAWGSALLLVVGVTAGGDSAESTPLPAAAQCNGPNLLANPSFEGDYAAYVPPGGHPDCPAGICQTAQMAAGWTPWWRSHDPGDPGHEIRMPEFKPALATFTNPPRVADGERAQQYFTFYSTHEAGFYQQVDGLQPGATYQFTIWGHSWSAQDDGDAYSGPEDGQLAQRIGIDPTGGTDWQSADIVWSDARQVYDTYDQFALELSAVGPTATVFTWSRPQWAVKHNDVYWDDAALRHCVTCAVAVAPAVLGTVAESGAPLTVQQAVSVTLTDALTWTAALAPDATLPLTLDQPQGSAGEPLQVGWSTDGLATGVYSATVVVSAESCPTPPAAVTVTVIVADQRHDSHMPAVTRP